MDEKTTNYIAMMTVWRETAKSLSQLAAAALVLPTFFLHELVGIPDGQPLLRHANYFLLASWACFFVAVIAGAAYQVTSARVMGNVFSNTYDPPLYPQGQFRILVAALGLGAFLFLFAVATAP